MRILEYNEILDIDKSIYNTKYILLSRTPNTDIIKTYNIEYIDAQDKDTYTFNVSDGINIFYTVVYAENYGKLDVIIELD